MKETLNICLFTNTSNNFSLKFVKGVLSEYQKNSHYNIWLLPPHNPEEQLKSLQQKITIHGIIARGISKESSEFFNTLDIPQVILRGIDSTYQSNSSLQAYQNNLDKTCAEIAFNALNKLNLKSFACVYHRDVLWSKSRADHFLNLAKEQNKKLHALSIPPQSLETNFNSNWAKWLKALPPKTGIFATNDEIATKTIQMARINGLTTPRDFSIIGVDNDEILTQLSSPQLSSIELFSDQLGKSVFNELRMLLDESVSRQELLTPSPRLIIRASTHTIDASQKMIERVFNLIESNPLQGSSIEELAEKCGVSKRTIERAFRSHKLESPAKLSRNYRTHAILQLLSKESLSLDAISQEANFSNLTAFSNFLKRQTGLPPLRMRKKLKEDPSVLENFKIGL